MRIGLQTWGSDGDIRPFFSLGAALRAAGHEVVLAATTVDGKDYAPLAARHGIEFRAVSPFYPDAALAAQLSAALSGGHPLQQLRFVLATFFDPILDTLTEAALDLAGRCDVVAGHTILHPLAHAAEKHGIPWLPLSPIPQVAPTRAFPPLALPSLGPANRAAWWLMLRLIHLVSGKPINAVRRRLGLPALNNALVDLNERAAGLLVACSPTLVGRPRDWPDKIHLLGDLNLPPEADTLTLPPAVEDFFASGPAPLFVGFGSMSQFCDPDGSAMRGLIAAARRTGARVIAQHPALEAGADPGLLVLQRAPHRALFPRCAGVIHHGGAGTTHEAARASVPMLVVPHLIDQTFWASRATALGIAPSPLHARKLGTADPTPFLRPLMADQSLKTRAREVGQSIGRENGADRALQVIEKILAPAR